MCNIQVAPNPSTPKETMSTCQEVCQETGQVMKPTVTTGFTGQVWPRISSSDVDIGNNVVRDHVRDVTPLFTNVFL